MKCPKCQSENRDQARFCDACGHSLASLPDPLPTQISFDNKAERIWRYLPKGLSEKILAQKDKIEGERKQVTVMFCDIAGFTPLVEKLGPEEAYSLMDLIYEILIHQVQEYEGTVNELTGDGIMALFGAPIALEDAPQRALRSALSIQSEIARFNKQNKMKIPIQMRVGIHTGPVVVGTLGNDLRVEFKAVGDTVNLASRMEGLAEPGSTYVTGDTFKLAEGLFQFDYMGERAVKGKDEIVPVYRLLSAKKETYRPRLGSERMIYSEMVGRDKELGKLEFQVMKAINGQGSIVSIIGEAGIGKSRIVAELKERDIMKQITLLEGRAISIGRNLPFHPIIDLLKQWALIREGDSELTAFEKLQSAIQNVCGEKSHEILPFVGTLMGMNLPERHANRVKGIEGEALEKLILKSVRDLVTKATELSPIVIVAEDLHWADTSTIDLVLSLFRLAERRRLMFVNVFRPGHEETGDHIVKHLKQDFSDHYVEILLEPLDSKSSETIIGNILRIDDIPRSVTDQILQRVDGNPFFIEEVVRSFVDEGALVLKDGAYVATQKIHSMIIPQTINDVLMARIDRLEEKTRDLVKVASVIGRTFFYRILADVVKDVKDIKNRLSYLKEVQIIRERKRMEEVEYLFKHALAQEAAYDSILAQKRKTLHLSVAHSIEKVFEGKIHEFYGMLAYHYSKGEDLDKTEEYLIKAGKEALRSSASIEAMNYYKEGLNLYKTKYGDAAEQEKLATFEKNIAISSFNKGQWESAKKYVDSVLDRWGVGSPKNRVTTLLKCILDLMIVCISLYLPSNKGTKIPDERQNEIFDLSYKRAISLVELDPAKCFSEYLSTLRSLTRFHISSVENGIGMWVSASGLFSWTGISFRLSRRMLDYNKELIHKGNAKDILYYRLFELIHKSLEGDWINIPKYEDSLVQSNLKRGETWHVSLYLLFHGYLLIYRGEFGLARIIIEQLAEMGESYGIDYGREYFYTLSILLGMMSGNLDTALNHVDDGISFMIKTHREMIILYYYGFRCIIQSLSNDITGAKESFSKAKELIDKQTRVPPIYVSTSLLGNLLLHLKGLQAAVAYENKSTKLKDHKKIYKAAKRALNNSQKFAFSRAEALRLMGSYFWLIGKQDRALRLWSQSMISAEQLGARVDLAKVYIEIGFRLLENQSKHVELAGISADEYLSKARSLYENMQISGNFNEKYAVPG